MTRASKQTVADLDSGKSSLLATLLRCLDLNSGIVTIDGQDISRISRDALRKRIMTLPQKSLFIHDSIRANMLMWDEAATTSGTAEEIDAQIESYLRKVGIWDALFTRKPSPSSPSSTHSSSTSSITEATEVTEVTDITETSADNEKKKKKPKKSKKSKPTDAAQDPEGDNKPKEEDAPTTLDSPLNPESRLSIGQQQLFCLARALFQRGDSQIVLMDEFTSSMDHETEMLVREIVARDLRGKTVIEVLHRLEHILDFDLVVVLEKGRVVEVGHPEELLQNEEGVLRDLFQSMRG
jgi:ABC-type multidrug transport system fused ATPase/permease subunit